MTATVGVVVGDPAHSVMIKIKTTDRVNTRSAGLSVPDVTRDDGTHLVHLGLAKR
jgi:hypothetical protein